MMVPVPGTSTSTMYLVASIQRLYDMFRYSTSVILVLYDISIATYINRDVMSYDQYSESQVKSFKTFDSV